jgi:CheY-like chemotaxis protein
MVWWIGAEGEIFNQVWAYLGKNQIRHYGFPEQHQFECPQLFGNCSCIMELAGRIGDAMVAATPKILVIDDQHLIANTLAQILNQNGYDAAPVYSSEEALEQVNRSEPDIVLSDVRMHKLDGIQTAMRIQILHPNCRVILFSASAISDEEQARIDDCGFEFLRRPLHPRDVLHHLRGKPAENVIPFRTARASDTGNAIDLSLKEATQRRDRSETSTRMFRGFGPDFRPQ